MTWSRLRWLLMTLLSFSVVLVASRYLRLDPSTYFVEQREVYMQRETVLVMHIVGGMLALACGPWQFVRGLRARWPRLHRVTGRVYVLGCALGAVAGLALATTAHGGAVASLGFASLAVAWVATTAIALGYAVARRVEDHRRWMVRSFAVTFAAVTLRLWLGFYGGLEAAGTSVPSFETAYAAVAWLCWVPNLAIAWFMTPASALDRSGTRQSRALGSVPS